MGKIKAVWELFDEASCEVSRNGKAWTDYLKFASRIYKYNFDNALQIYGQNKDATMLAEREIWENRIGRAINKEHTNIAVFDVMSAKPQLRYLIDISDTSGDEKTYPRLWRLTPENSQPLLERLKEKQPMDANTIEAYIGLEALRRVNEIRPGFYDGIKRNTEDSPLFAIEEDELKDKVNIMVWNSAVYMMYERCGFDTSGLDGQFEDISDFNNKSLLYRMGNCATIIARDFLSECATNLNQLAKERREQAAREKNYAEPQIIAPHDSAKRRISDNIRKGAGKTAEANPAQLSIFGDEEVTETVDNNSVSDEIDDDEVIKSIASYGSLIAGGKQRIYEFFQNNTSWKDRVNFLKNEYGICGASVTVDDKYYSWMADGKGIEYHAIENSDNKKRITWNSFAKYVQDAINECTYYIPESKAEIDESMKPDFKYGDFISLNGNIFEVLDSDEKEQTTDLGDIQFYVSPHTYVLVEATSWEDLRSAKLVDTPEKALPETHINANNNRDEAIYPVSDTENADNIINTPVEETEENIVSTANNIELSVAELFEKIHSEDNGKTIALFPLGDFYEAYGDDAKNLAKELDLHQTNKVVDGRKYDMCGFPNHVLEKYVNALNDKGYDVALVDKNDKVYRIISTEKALGNEVDTETAVAPVIENRIDYTYSPDDNIDAGGPKAKFKANVEAIKLLNQIESENRLATADEQRILCKYVGWGGLSEAFDENNSSWSSEYTELKGLLTDDEYKSALASVLCAHYTPPEIIENIYATIERMGFKGGNVLDPAMGTGLFFAAMPEEIKKNSKLYGYEIDDISGRIAKQLTQTANIKIQGYETNEEPDNFFDIAVGNIPFGEYRLFDPKFNKYKFLIHDYFIAKTLEKVRPGGIIAFISSKGTLDKENDSLRRYVGNRAELLGAVRMPNNTFRKMANTEVTADVIFLQKRERIVSVEPYWTKLDVNSEGIPINAYFEKNPFMLLGSMQYDNRFGTNSITYLKAEDDFDLKRDLPTALSAIEGHITEYKRTEETDSEETIPADPNVRNFTYAFVDSSLYYRENSVMRKMEYEGKALERIKNLCEIRDITRGLIEAQTDEEPDEVIDTFQNELNKRYDLFVKKYGNISASANERVFRDDGDYPLLCSLEKYDDETKTYSKADIFSKRTIKPEKRPESVDNALDALKLSLSEYGRVNIDYMNMLYRIPKDEIFEELKGQIYLNPEKIGEALPFGITLKEYFDKYGDRHRCIETADEYLSGDVRQKLKMARFSADGHPQLFSDNAEALESVQPPLLTAAEIAASTGLTWIDKEDYTKFLYEKFNTPSYYQYGSNAITVEYNRFTNIFAVRNKSNDSSSVTVTQTYGTNRMNAYEIFEASLNMRSATVHDAVEKNGKMTYPINQKESMLAREKQYLIEEAFRSWIFEEPERRKKYVDYYNENFNNIRLRKYDGSFLTFPGMTNDVIMREHQKNAVARALFSNTNELLDHKVGAGKSFVMVASCMELKRLGLANKSIFVVPNHLTGQMGAEFLRLYPFANILVTTKKDFEKKNRLKFVSKIATGDWDAVIIGHSQFEKISMSKERQIMMLEKQVNEIVEAVAIAKAENGDRITIKQMEKMKTNLNTQIQELADDSQKDDLITFESLGIDYMFVDEAHYFKNCAVFSKMRNVAGIAQTKAKKATDMLMKCRYMQEINEGKGIVFATGTPISNSMTEMFVMQRYLDPKELEKRHMMHFDAWAAQYGECVTSLELAPEGTGYRYRTRFAKFKNMPELLTMYHNFADVVTDEDLNLPIPKMRGGKPIVVNSEPSDFVVLQMMEFVERANAIHNGQVSSTEDNMLKITNEARLLATDPRLIDPLAEHTADSKVSMCAENVYREYEKNADIKGTQIVFCDIGTPKAEGIYNVYDGLKADLILKGIPEDDICFIHDAKTDAQREELFALMRSGEKRVIIGSTSKLGVGTNIQNRIVALHNLDCPYRPSDIEQRLGRGLRQGNINDEVGVYTYVTQNTFDAYMWQIVENKQRFISQIKSGRMVDRTCEDIDETVLTFAEVKAIATGDERIKEKMDLDLQVNRLKMLKSNYDNQRYSLQDQFTTKYPRAIAEHEKTLEKLMADKEAFEKNTPEKFCVTVAGQLIDEREKAGEIFITMAKSLQVDEKKNIGSFCGFNLEVEKLKEFGDVRYYLRLVGNLIYKTGMSNSAQGNTVRIENLFKTMNEKITETQGKLETDRKNLENAKAEYEKPFAYEDELKEKSERLMFLNSELDLDKKDDVVEENQEDEDDEQSENQSEQPNEKHEISALRDMPYSVLEKKNYQLIHSMFPEMLDGRSSYMKFKKESFDDMYIENIGDNTLALCLFYILNGDVMREPEYTFKFDNENKAVRILEWQLDSMGMYHHVYDSENPQLYNSKLKKDLDEIFNSTLNDIMKIGYEEYTRNEADEECDEAEI